MEDDEFRRHEHLVLCPMSIYDMLMDLALVAKIGTIAEDAQLEDRAHEAVSLILVDIDEAADHADDGLRALLHLQEQRTHLGNRLRTEIFVRVKEEDPIALRLFQRAVLRGGKIVLPRMMKDACARRLRHLDRTVGRAGIDDNHLVGKLLH